MTDLSILNAKVSVALLCVSLSAVALALLCQKLSPKRLLETDAHQINEDNKNVVEEDLLEKESAAVVLGLPAISTITFFHGDVDAFEAFLRTRLQLVVDHNPWLQGRLVRATARERDGQRVKLRYALRGGEQGERVKSTSFSLSREEVAFTLDASMDIKEIASRLESFHAKRGVDAVDRDEPLLRVTLLVPPRGMQTSEEKTEKEKEKEKEEYDEKTRRCFALVFSLSHVVADGHTFYALYGMLSVSGTPRALCVTREHGVDAALRQRTHGVDNMAWFRSPGFVCNLLLGALGCGGAPDVFVQPLDLEKIAREKEREMERESVRSLDTQDESERAPFVSTNDVVTSALLCALRSDVGLFAVNLRGRLPGIAARLAGNYESMILLQPADYATPSLVRRALMRLRRVYASEALPSGMQCALRSRVSLISSWATLYEHLHVSEDLAAHVLHLPVFPLQIKTSDAVVLFCPRERELAMLVVTRTYRQRTSELKEKLRGMQLF